MILLEQQSKHFSRIRNFLTIKETVSFDHSFQFEHCQVYEVLREISKLDGKKNGILCKNGIFKNISKEMSDV